MHFYSRSRAAGAADGGQCGENCGGVQQTELYIGVVSVVQSPIEADRTSAVTSSSKKVRGVVNETPDHRGSDHRSHSHRDRAWCRRYVCGVGLHGRIGDLTCAQLITRQLDRANFD
jgi:hypothetical protein